MENKPQTNPATPEEIWAILREVSRKQEKSVEQAERRQKEAERRQKEAEQRWNEAEQRWKEIDQQVADFNRGLEKNRLQMEDTDRRLKKTDELFNSQWGKLVESLVEGDLVAMLRVRGIQVESTHSRVSGHRDGEHYEFDILAINGEEVVVVEVKTKLRSEDVTHFLEKLARFTAYEPVWKGKHIFGAVAYLKTDSSVQACAERRGLFVIRATGSSASIINRTGFRPKRFC